MGNFSACYSYTDSFKFCHWVQNANMDFKEFRGNVKSPGINAHMFDLDCFVFLLCCIFVPFQNCVHFVNRDSNNYVKK